MGDSTEEDKKGIVSGGGDAVTKRAVSKTAVSKDDKNEAYEMSKMTPQQRMEYDRAVRRKEIETRNNAKAEADHQAYLDAKAKNDKRYQASREKMEARRKAWADGTDFTGLKSVSPKMWVGWGAGGSDGYKADEVGAQAIQDWARDFAGKTRAVLPAGLVKEDGSIDLGKVKSDKQFNALLSLAQADRDDLAERQARVDARLGQVGHGQGSDRIRNMQYLQGKGYAFGSGKDGRSLVSSAQLAKLADRERRRDVVNALVGFERVRSNRDYDPETGYPLFGEGDERLSTESVIRVGRAAGLKAYEMADDYGNISPSKIKAALRSRHDAVMAAAQAPAAQAPAATAPTAPAPTTSAPTAPAPAAQAPAATASAVPVPEELVPAAPSPAVQAPAETSEPWTTDRILGLPGVRDAVRGKLRGDSYVVADDQARRNLLLGSASRFVRPETQQSPFEMAGLTRSPSVRPVIRAVSPAGTQAVVSRSDLRRQTLEAPMTPFGHLAQDARNIGDPRLANKYQALENIETLAAGKIANGKARPKGGGSKFAGGVMPGGKPSVRGTNVRLAARANPGEGVILPEAVGTPLPPKRRAQVEKWYRNGSEMQKRFDEARRREAEVKAAREAATKERVNRRKYPRLQSKRAQPKRKHN